MRRTAHVLSVAALTGATLGAAASTALADPTARVSPDTVSPGGSVTVSVSCDPTGGIAPATLDATSQAFAERRVQLHRIPGTGTGKSGPVYRGVARIASAEQLRDRDPHIKAEDPSHDGAAGRDPGEKAQGNKEQGNKEQGEQEPGEKEPGKKEPGEKNPVGKDSVGKDPAGKDQAGEDPAGGEPTGQSPMAGEDSPGALGVQRSTDQKAPSTTGRTAEAHVDPATTADVPDASPDGDVPDGGVTGEDGTGEDVPETAAAAGPEAPAGEAASRTARAQDPAAGDPTAQDPAAQDPAAQDPAAQNPAGKEPAGKEPAGKEPAGQEPADGGPGAGFSAGGHPEEERPSSADGGPGRGEHGSTWAVEGTCPARPGGKGAAWSATFRVIGDGSRRPGDWGGVQAGEGGAFSGSVPALVAGGVLIAGAFGAAAHRLLLRRSATKG
ncbi:hypothetical protein [Streptomyces sp. H51]|uniref:hypothetical protein n=1 Tax=Streptomyces sp. H51 TaxID=3111770 RepID=UPI002D77E567|nr:hypothetical protein [Streptomyces sp. H51]